MNEWVVSSLVAISVLEFMIFIAWLKEEHDEILGFIVTLMLSILLLIGVIYMVHDFIYGPLLRGGG